MGVGRDIGHASRRGAALLLASALAVVLAGAPPALARSQSLDYVDFLGDRGTDAPGACVARTAEQWLDLWALTAATPPRGLGKGEIAVGIFAGTRPTGGYSLTTRKVIADGDTVTVEIEERRPWPGAVVTQALTAPYVIVVFDSEAEEVTVYSRTVPVPPPERP